VGRKKSTFSANDTADVDSDSDADTYDDDDDDIVSCFSRLAYGEHIANIFFLHITHT